ncbi:MAG: FAD-dependent oxidoreductase [Parashewanella sp.]
MTQDAVIIGGGMVGAAAAIGLAQLGLSVTVIENYLPQIYDETAALDIRVSAISVASERLLNRLGAWSSLSQMRKAIYTGLETWELDGFATEFSCEQLGESHLGYIIENRLIQLALWQQFERYDNLTLLCPEKVTAFEQTADDNAPVTLTLTSGNQLQTKLLLGCDGANSTVRDWAGIGITGWDYQQSAMLINIETQTPQQSVTWQQFTPNGPRSLLPLPGNNASLVWYDSPQTIARLMQLNPTQLADKIREHFPSRLDPHFTVIDKGSFPLTRRHANRYFDNNIVLLGDAAHTINPLAGQGVNLGFKDVDALIDKISQAISSNTPWHANSVLQAYQKARYNDNLLMQTGMDVFYKTFSNNLTPLKVVRNAALKLANIDSPLKNKVLKYALGLS